MYGGREALVEDDSGEDKYMISQVSGKNNRCLSAHELVAIRIWAEDEGIQTDLTPNAEYYEAMLHYGRHEQLPGEQSVLF